jgi:hypothetical protein
MALTKVVWTIQWNLYHTRPSCLAARRGAAVGRAASAPLRSQRRRRPLCISARAVGRRGQRGLRSAAPAQPSARRPVGTLGWHAGSAPHLHRLLRLQPLHRRILRRLLHLGLRRRLRLLGVAGAALRLADRALQPLHLLPQRVQLPRGAGACVTPGHSLRTPGCTPRLVCICA